MQRSSLTRTSGPFVISLLLAPLLLSGVVATADERALTRDAARAHAFAGADVTREHLVEARGTGRPALLERRPSKAGLSLRSGDGAEDLTSRSECYVDAHYDDLDGSDLDVADYGMLYECEFANEWAYLVRTADAWATSELDDAVLQLDADGVASTGCGGFEYLILAYEGTSGLIASLYETPTCDTAQASFLRDVEVLRTTSQNLAVFFDNRLIGDPNTFYWAGDLTARSDTTRDFLPNVGFHHAVDFKSPTEACAAASQGYTLSSSDSRAPSVLRAAGATDVRRAGSATVTFQGDIGRALSALRRSGIEGGVEPNDLMVRMVAPNDLTAEQWAPSQVSASGAWDVTRGNSVMPVGVIDSGIDATHPDLAGKVQTGYDAYTGQALPSGNSDRDGHGTSVASLIGAATDNGGGIAGLGWHTPVIAIRPDDPDGNISSAAVAAGIRWGADRGIRVLNISLGSCVFNQALADAVAYASSRGTLIVAAAGNEAQEGNPVNYPAALPSVIAVGATGFGGAHAPYSNTGSHVDLVAPGGSAGADGDLNHGMLVLAPAAQVTRVDGTSFSAPVVSAGAALVLSVNPQLTPDQVTQMLLSTATDLGVAGRDDTYGVGMLNLERAVRAAETSLPAASPSPTATTPAASPTYAPADSKPSVVVVNPTISAGGRVTVTYWGTPDTIIDVYSRTQPATEFSYIRSVLLDANGFGSSTHAPQKNTRITATSASGEFSPNAPIIEVRSVASLNVQRVGPRAYTFTGRVYPARPNRAVFLYRDGSYIGVMRCDANGVYKVTAQGLAPGTSPFQAVTSNDTWNLGTRSPVRRAAIY